ncbi:error-prone DNA polymerase [Aquihabitans sp. McL0605]|uniref:error-prone DNA polymerase n=1 Tax=Aquihabitans sp. McL0605 TaxID=3415671 RepID=UPI003CF7C17D
MAFNNPSMPWSELERRLTGKDGRDLPPPEWANGGDSPAWSRKRAPYQPPPDIAWGGGHGSVPYAELHCHTNFSFLDGASHPEELAEEAARLGLEALAVTDHDGFYGVVRFAEAARAVGLPTVFGTELTLDGPVQPPLGEADPPGEHLVVLARNPQGYARLARAATTAQLAGQKGAPRIGLEQLAELAGGQWAVLSGCRKGPLAVALERDGPAAAGRALDRMVGLFGAEHVHVELWDHGDPLDTVRNDALAQLALRRGVPLVATNNVHYAVPAKRRLATALAAVRARRSLVDIDGWLPGGAGAHLRSGLEQARRFARYPGVVAAAAELGRSCAFDLRLVAPDLPPYPCPDGLDEMALLRRLVEEGASRRDRYGPRPTTTSTAPLPRTSCDHPGVPPGDHRMLGSGPRAGSGAGSTATLSERAWRQIDHELAVIEALGFPGYFLIVWDIVEFCRREDIYCQGRGSAANSAACWALGITKADAVRLGLLFERFLSPERDGPPDIDLDIESGRREEVIQYVYQRYGRHYAAQVANVITYRSRSAVRDMAKALGADPGQQDAWSKQLDPWKGVKGTAELPDQEIPPEVLELAAEVEHFPRHLGIHSGGMVLCDRPVIEVCPVEWARMEDRSVLQWDKDDCAAVGLVKFDLLGLGMLTALHHMVDLTRIHADPTIDLATIPQEDAVYDMLCKADSIGVFQVESRAQMATLPRLRPRTFYDLVVEVALIRPGPIQGGSVHPYIRRRNGKEAVTYLHPLLEPALKKTLGIPLFQEQLMQMAIDVAGFSPGEADQLRQAMGSKRSVERMERLSHRLYEGMAERGITGAVADEIYAKLAAFANFGFPESHSVSFAYLVYASAWFKLHHPAAFCAGLLNAQPMGFYSPHTLVEDARRHGVEVRTPCIAASAADATLEPCEPSVSAGGVALRLGISSVRGIGDDLGEQIAAGRPYADMEAVARRNDLSLPQLEALATAGAFAAFDADPEAARGPGSGRRTAIWEAGAVAQGSADQLAGIVTGTAVPALPGMDARETAVADLWATGMAPDGHPTRFLRQELERLGVVPADQLAGRPDGSRVLVGGVVTHRQRPATAAGTTFLNLEDETGLVNVIVSKGCWVHHRRLVQTAPALLIRGRLETAEGVTNVIAETLSLLPLTVTIPSRDFR